jgi:hypothetical protein
MQLNETIGWHQEAYLSVEEKRYASESSETVCLFIKILWTDSRAKTNFAQAYHHSFHVIA